MRVRLKVAEPIGPRPRLITCVAIRRLNLRMRRQRRGALDLLKVLMPGSFVNRIQRDLMRLDPANDARFLRLSLRRIDAAIVMIVPGVLPR